MPARGCDHIIIAQAAHCVWQDQPANVGASSPGRESQSTATLYISLVILCTKYTGWRQQFTLSPRLGAALRTCDGYGVATICHIRPDHASAKGAARARSHFRFEPPLIYLIPDYPLYTRFTNVFGASISEMAMRPNPRRGGAAVAVQRRGAGDAGLLQVGERLAPPPLLRVRRGLRGAAQGSPLPSRVV
jgi:hypothetical protein